MEIGNFPMRCHCGEGSNRDGNLSKMVLVLVMGLGLGLAAQ